jgi:hypothetical protein
MRLRKSLAITQLIDIAQRLRIVRQAEREFVRNWANEKRDRAQQFHSEDRVPNEGLPLQFPRVFDDE